MSDLGTVRAALAASLSGIQDVQVSAYVSSSPTPPGIQILPPGIEFHKAMQNGLSYWNFVVQGFVALTTDRGPQVVLDALCATTGPQSVKAAIEADQTLGGVVQGLMVTEQTPGRVAEPTPGLQMLLVEWHVQVYV